LEVAEKKCTIEGGPRDRIEAIVFLRFQDCWRVSWTFFNEWKNGIPHDLCFLLNNCAVLFPSRETAMMAAEIFSTGQHMDIAPFAWKSYSNQIKFGGDPAGASGPFVSIKPRHRLDRRHVRRTIAP
jgi:hypothetical protein